MTCGNDAARTGRQPGAGQNPTTTDIDGNPRPPARSNTRWKGLERVAAKKLGGRRLVRQDFFESSPDVVVPDFGLVVECKSRKRHAFHNYLDQAEGYCRDGEIPALVTKSHGQHGAYITVPLDWLSGILDELRGRRR